MATREVGGDRIALHDLEVRLAPYPVPHEGRPAHAREAPLEGIAEVASVHGPGGIDISVALVTWPDGVREMLTRDVKNAPEHMEYDSGSTGLRNREWEGRTLTFMDLEALSVRPNRDWPGAVVVNEDHLDWILGSSSHDFLIAHGALVVGTRNALFGDRGAVMNRLTMGFAEDNTALPRIAYAFTRQLAMYRRFDRDTWNGQQ